MMKTTTASPISLLEFIAHIKSRSFPSIPDPRSLPGIMFTALGHSFNPAARGDEGYHCFPPLLSTLLDFVAHLSRSWRVGLRQ
jgi:hypothetical protein